jgi:hypothetical protein
MLPREKHLLGCSRPKPSQVSVSTGLTLASDFSFCFQCQVGSSLVLRRPIGTTAVTGKVRYGTLHDSEEPSGLGRIVWHG